MIKEWIEENDLKCKIITDGVIETPIGLMIEVVPEKGTTLFSSNFELNVSISDEELAEQSEAKHYLFAFGGSYYYTPIESTLEPELNLFKYVGTSSTKKFNWSFLGVHGKYDIMNGSRDFSDWCRKANFYKVKSLGLCDYSTLAGALHFQSACEASNIKSIIGASYTIQTKDFKTYNVKLYVVNSIGWRNILNINKNALVDNREDKVVTESFLIDRSKGLFCVLDPSGTFPLESTIDILKNAEFEDTYFQFDTSEMKSDEEDQYKLERLKYYLDNLKDKIKPAIIKDAY